MYHISKSNITHQVGALCLLYYVLPSMPLLKDIQLEHTSYMHCSHNEYNNNVGRNDLSQIIQNAANNDKKLYQVSTF